MRLKELENKQNADSAFENMDRYRVLGEDSVLITTGVSNGEPVGISANSQNRKYWNWDNSLRSNCDNFLETLEYDIGAESLFDSKILHIFFFQYCIKLICMSQYLKVVFILFFPDLIEDTRSKEIDESPSTNQKSFHGQSTPPKWPAQRPDDNDHLVQHQTKLSVSIPVPNIQ